MWDASSSESDCLLTNATRSSRQCLYETAPDVDVTGVNVPLVVVALLILGQVAPAAEVGVLVPAVCSSLSLSPLSPLLSLSFSLVSLSLLSLHFSIPRCALRSMLS